MNAEAAIADAVEAAAFADLFAAAPAALKSHAGMRVEQVAGATALIAPGLPTTMFNRVIGVGNQQPADEATIDSLVSLYRSAGVGNWWLHVNPHASPVDLAQRLEQRGFGYPARRRWAKMLRSSAALAAPPSTLQIVPASDGDIATVIHCITQAFGMPPPMADWLAQLHKRPGWRVYAVCDDGVPVGGACLFVDGATGWLGMGSVVESHQRRGGQLASMARRIDDAAAAGCTQIVTETGEPVGDEPNPSLANMARAGFERVASRLNLEWKDAAASG